MEPLYDDHSDPDTVRKSACSQTEQSQRSFHSRVVSSSLLKLSTFNSNNTLSTVAGKKKNLFRKLMKKSTNMTVEQLCEQSSQSVNPLLQLSGKHGIYRSRNPICRSADMKRAIVPLSLKTPEGVEDCVKTSSDIDENSTIPYQQQDISSLESDNNSATLSSSAQPDSQDVDTQNNAAESTKKSKKAREISPTSRAGSRSTSGSKSRKSKSSPVLKKSKFSAKSKTKSGNENVIERPITTLLGQQSSEKLVGTRVRYLPLSQFDPNEDELNDRYFYHTVACYPYDGMHELADFRCEQYSQEGRQRYVPALVPTTHRENIIFDSRLSLKRQLPSFSRSKAYLVR